jgi:hypothetical protein
VDRGGFGLPGTDDRHAGRGARPTTSIIEGDDRAGGYPHRLASRLPMTAIMDERR